MNFNFLKTFLKKRSALQVLFWFNAVFFYSHRDLASIHSMKSLQAILTVFKEVVTHAL